MTGSSERGEVGETILIMVLSVLVGIAIGIGLRKSQCNRPSYPPMPDKIPPPSIPPRPPIEPLGGCCELRDKKHNKEKK